jgi:hypothetical protein
MVIFITGYRRMGKDTLYKQLCGKIPFNWIIYRYKDVSKTFPPIKSYKRVAFADELKREVIEYYKLPYTLEEVEKIKDERILYTLTFRDLCIELSKEKRKLDTNYWINKVRNLVDDNTIITDWRYPNELYINDSNTITIRVHRHNVPIPDLSIESEHALDGYKTDFLLVDKDDVVRLYDGYIRYHT